MFDKPRIYLFSSTRLIDSIIHKHSCKIIYISYRLELSELYIIRITVTTFTNPGLIMV